MYHQILIYNVLNSLSVKLLLLNKYGFIIVSLKEYHNILIQNDLINHFL